MKCVCVCVGGCLHSRISVILFGADWLKINCCRDHVGDDVMAPVLERHQRNNGEGEDEGVPHSSRAERLKSEAFKVECVRFPQHQYFNYFQI